MSFKLDDWWSKLEFRKEFRRYQNQIIEQLSGVLEKDDKFHIVAPPGAGKTIVGIELVKRLKKPAVVFAPTSTIQMQWREKVRMFLHEDDLKHLDKVVGMDPKKIRPINVYTYQLISTPGEQLDFVYEAAKARWQERMLTTGLVETLQEAAKRMEKLKTNNPDEYENELAKHYKNLKDNYLRDPDFDGSKFLHPNAKRLIDDLVSGGVKIVVLDEVHHLLDYWALVIKELVKRIGTGAKLVGLTATPPVTADEEEMANYLDLIGTIDYEIPTPAVVKEGNLAPYQDLVFFCHPTEHEKKFIKSLSEKFKALVAEIGQREDFSSWIKKRIIERPMSEGGKQDWTKFFNQNPFLAIAGIKYLQQIVGLDIPSEIVEIEEMEKELGLDDWVYLLTDYSLNFLKVSESRNHHEELERIRLVLKTFGYVLTESGMRQLRSPADKILSFSKAKFEAMIKILHKEMENLGKDLRVVVILDFEKESATIDRALKGVLDQDSGSAAMAFKTIVNDEVATKLEPVLLTGSTVLVDADMKEHILKHMNEWRKDSGLSFSFRIEPTDEKKIVELVGEGKDWKTNAYVRMVTELFERGTIKCIVGTRGLLGEGWDSLSLNTLIDLTSVTTSMSVNQIRGRSIRLDPENGQKVANNWDVVCVDPNFEKGDQDFARFTRKHRQFYGLGSKGKIVKGYGHVDEGLALNYQTLGFKRVLYHLVNTRMLAKSADRAEAYRNWGVGQKYSNFEYVATKLDVTDIKFKTVHSLKNSLVAIFNALLAAAGTFTLYYLYVFQDLLGIGFENVPIALFLGGIFVVGICVACAKHIYKYARMAFVELPVDSFVLDMGKALLRSLRECKLISENQSVDNVRVIKDDTGYYDVYLDYAKREDANLFAKSLNEILAPVVDSRYLVSRSEDNINIGFYSPIWWTLRKIFRLIKQERVAYHQVPLALAVHKDRAENFAKNWKEYVGGGDLIYTRSEEGRELLIKQRRLNRHKVKRMIYEIWK